jgi:AcrR family transcriptional regulator
MKFGIRSISMDDIARELGISKKTLYLYFTNKADLIAKILELHEKESLHCFQDNAGTDVNAIDELIEISRTISEDLKKYNPSALFDLNKYYPEIIKPFFERRKTAVRNFTAENLKRGIRQGLYRHDLDIEIVSQLYIKKLEGVHEFIFANNENYTFNKIFFVMFDNHIRGIANTQGLIYYEQQQNKFEDTNI